MNALSKASSSISLRAWRSSLILCARSERYVTIRVVTRVKIPPPRPLKRARATSDIRLSLVEGKYRANGQALPGTRCLWDQYEGRCPTARGRRSQRVLRQDRTDPRSQRSGVRGP